MKRKARIQTGIDDRLVAIYARKSRITNKGDSIGVQFKQSADYAVNQLSLPEDYEFARYEDKGLSGYYSDRPDFQRLLRDIEMGKIKAVACYKLDRISRKTSDLMRLLEYFERHDVTLLVCSNNINTRISTSKIIIQVLAIIAEFERDILTERIQDNLMELAKDGRWLGGKTPTGFSSQRVTTGSGKNKSAISFLVPVQEEKEIVLEIYGTFWETRSLLQTANIINEKYETKHGAKFTTSTIRLILRNPIYCVADEYSYNYFLEHDGNLFGEPSDFDGQHGLTAYNKTDQMKVEDEDSTFFNPKFSQLLTRKPISEWIVSVGRHEGFISSRKWVETQNMLDEIAEKYNRPHRKTNALLSGLMYCPICGKRLRVLPESNRWTNGKPRFKYACPGVRAKECTFKGVEGVTLDEFVIHSLSSLQEEHSDYYRQLLENRVASMIRTDQSEKEYQETKKAIERLNADIAAQVRNLREADDALKRFIQDDIKKLTDELAKREAALRRMEDTQSENQYLIHELNGMKKRLLSFEEFAKDAQPEALFTLVHSIVDRIYITTDGTKQKCQVYIKGCATEDYSDVLGAAGYIEEEPLLPVVAYMPPMCDLDYYSITNEILLNDVTNSIEVSAELVDRVGYAIPVGGNYDRDNNLIETAGGESTPETAYTITELTKIPDNVVFKNDNGVVLDNMVRENGDASVVITPAEGWRIRDIIIDEPENAENSEESENIMSVQPVLAEDGTETGAYLVSDVNVTKNMEFKVDAVKLYSVTIADTEHGNIKVTKPDGTEVENGEMIDEKTVLTYTATPDMYYDFDAWTEDAADQAESTFEKALDGSITVGAAFKARYAKVSIATVKNGTVTVTTADGKKISNGQLVQEGTDIICKAIPAKHCDLSAWGGDAKGKTGTTVKLTVTKNMNIRAAFKFRYVKVAIGKTENGSITIKTAEGKTVKNGASVIEGTVLICTAKAANNCKLGSWTGSFKSTKTSVKVAANKNMKINARFVAKIPAQNTAGINKNIHAVVSGNKVTVVWGKVNKADGYDIYAQECYVNFNSKSLIKSVKGASATRVTISSINGKSLAKLDTIKLRVKAYKLVNGKKKYIDNSVMLHIVTNSSKYTNIKKVLLPQKSYVLGVKQTIKLKPGYTKADASKKVLDGTHGARYLYACTNKNVATVDAKGRIKTKAAGKCTVYVIAVNGTTQAVQIIVK